ncbi:MAG: hypothetical protein ACK5KU_00460 [Beutenbergiaceae bacterium]
MSPVGNHEPEIPGQIPIPQPPSAAESLTNEPRRPAPADPPSQAKRQQQLSKFLSTTTMVLFPVMVGIGVASRMFDFPWIPLLLIVAILGSVITTIGIMRIGRSRSGPAVPPGPRPPQDY